MHVVRSVLELRAAIAAARAGGARVGFVPTMGALHAGHLSLIDRARAVCDCVVLSIFVNPLQFAPTDDLATYPRTEAQDLELAAARGATIAFVPSVVVMFPGPRAVTVVPESIADRWEGVVRPGHFAGVLTVVAKLFNLVQPDVAVFGQKDLQQATLISAMVRDLDFPVQLDIAPIVREPDGLAMSSRNRYLNAGNRAIACALSRSLAAISQAYFDGVTNAAALRGIGESALRAHVALSIDYLDVVRAASLESVAVASHGDYVMLAARVGTTRLLDNHRLGDPFPALP